MISLTLVRDQRAPRLARFRAATLGVAAALAFSAPLLTPPTADAQQLAPVTFADLADRLSPAVVNISTAQTVTRSNRPMPNLPEGSPLEDLFRDFFDQRRGGGGDGGGSPRRVNSLGSGFVIDPEGYVVTNNHVIEGADEIEVNFADGSSLPAELIGRDPKTDIALLKVEPIEPLPSVTFGDSDVARVGDWVLAIGNPFGLGGSVSAGIISARNRDINSGPYDDFLQTDAAINRGNSGGPLFNMDGSVIGVNTAIISPSGGSIGIGFAVPSAIAESVVEQLREFGETRRGWLGVRIQIVDEDIAESLGLPRAEGALVAGVEPSGPAEAAAIQTGDVILSFDSQEVEEMRDLPRIVADTRVGSTVPVLVYREGEYVTLDVTVALLEEERFTAAAVENRPPRDGAEALGMSLRALDSTTRERYEIGPDVEGVVVTEVDGASSAFEKGIRAGDVIVEVSQTRVSAPEDAAAEVEATREAGRRSVLLMLQRDGELRFVAVEFDR